MELYHQREKELLLRENLTNRKPICPTLCFYFPVNMFLAECTYVYMHVCMYIK